MALVATLVCALLMPAVVHAQSPAPAPAPTSDGTSIDQGIAYTLMFLALLDIWLYQIRPNYILIFEIRIVRR
ncbi:hypothetical protein L6164_019380 [Bauhinia variegata]|uniref:Uncharacterized protein n=1 Tax=Bauhinia variegata TaxID=167791 RepID=A0ACB9MSW4_BAUVA|nr:hypothetical protein L6164_019380 [Bauhinia variegata]